MSRLDGKFILNDSVTDAKVRLRNNNSLRGRNAADSANVDILKVDSSNIVQLMSQTQIATTPSAGNDIANKTYVDTAVASGGSSWVNSVLDGPLNTPPGSPSVGDRYLVGASPSGAWSGQANKIAQYTVSGWAFTTAVAGYVVNVQSSTAGIYFFDGSAWSARDFEKTTASNGLELVGADVRVKFESSNPTLQVSSTALAVKLDGARAITTGASGLGVNLEGTNPTLQIATNQLGVKLDAAGAVVTGASGVKVNLETANPSLAIASNQLGVNVDAAGAIVKGASGIAVQLESATPTLQIATNQLGVKLDGSRAITSGASGIGVNLESANASLSISTNQLGVRVDGAGAIVKGSSGIAVQLEASNPTLQIATNRLGVKLNASGAIVTGASGVAVQVDAATVKINGSNQLEGLKAYKENFTLSATNITNGYIDLANLAASNSVLFFATGLLQTESSDYTLSTVGGVTRVTFAGDLIAAGTALVSGDKVTVAYQYL